jgi:probable H4MPT-linked C1 transfer pathway protein
MKRVLGLDIGGANLKLAHVNGMALVEPFALWTQPHNLAGALGVLVRQMPQFDALAVTMTGELCDCFPTRREGVLAILNAVEVVAAGSPIFIWWCEDRAADRPGKLESLKGALVTPERVRQAPLGAAAVNWLAQATFVSRFAGSGPGLLIDIGSTTTDIIPLLGGRPAPVALTDSERLRSGELAYTGVRRTPVCALLRSGVAAELFATSLDVYLVLRDLPEDGATDTADGRPATRELAHARLARLVCADGETCSRVQTQRLAARAARAQKRLLGRALSRVLRRFVEPPRTVIVAGSGEFLARRVLREEMGLAPTTVSLAERLGPAVSSACCAFAVAVLAAEEKHG